MKTIQSLKDININNHHQRFTQVFRSMDKRISFARPWVGGDQSDLSGVVFHESCRLIMEPGQYFACVKETRTNKREALHSPVMIMGTPYGTLCMHYPFEAKAGAGRSMFSN
ncbi:MAG TPA: hypothetical protein V6C65_37025, partial [Allocoleopsis sp.]